MRAKLDTIFFLLHYHRVHTLHCTPRTPHCTPQPPANLSKCATRSFDYFLSSAITVAADRGAAASWVRHRVLREEPQGVGGAGQRTSPRGEISVRETARLRTDGRTDGAADGRTDRRRRGGPSRVVQSCVGRQGSAGRSNYPGTPALITHTSTRYFKSAPRQSGVRRGGAGRGGAGRGGAGRGEAGQWRTRRTLPRL